MEQDTYSVLRQFADSWVLLAMFLFLVAVVVWLARPSARKDYEEASKVPFHHEDRPAPVDDSETSKDGQQPPADEDLK